MHKAFFVTGGVHRDFSFLFVDGEKEHYGPFPTYAAAFECWKARAWLNVDNALHRLFVEEREVSLPCGMVR
jgi:hypothetical protein